MRAFWVVVTIASRAALAAGPATLPVTRPANVDLSSPDATIRSLADAVDQDDAAAYGRIVAPQSDDQHRQVDGDIRMMLLGQRLVAAIRSNMGQAAAAEIAQGGGLGMFGMCESGHDGDDLRRLLEDQSIRWKYTGNEAFLGEVSPEIRVRQIEGKWHLILPTEDANDSADHDKMREQLAGLVEEIIRKINSGELKTTEEVGRQFFSSPTVSTAPSTTRPADPR